MAVAEIREPRHLTISPRVGPARVVTVLPPREGFSPEAVGAIGLLVHRMGQPGDVVVGQPSTASPFPQRRFVAAETPLWPPFGRVERYIAGAIRSVRRLRPGLIEVHNRANLALALAKACPTARVALFFHNDPCGMRQARSPAERNVLLRGMTVVCVSRHLAARFMEGLDPAGAAPIVLPNAIDLAALPPPAAPEHRRRAILFVGRIVADKGADSFVEACAAVLPALPGWTATMIGADRFWPGSKPTAFERALRPRASAAGVALPGYQPHRAVLEAMSNAAIVAVPSRWAEPFGMTALEAMACGAALVCSARGGLPEVVGEAAFLADPDEPGALEAALRHLADDPALRARLSSAGTERARLFDAVQARIRLAELRARLLAT